MRAISSSAIVAKRASASASHWITTNCPLHPEFALRTLLEFRTDHKLIKFLIILSKTIGDPILNTAHSSMVLTSTIQAIMFPADRTPIIVEDFIMSENCSASGSRTPRCIFPILLHEYIKTELIIFFLQISINKLLNIYDWKVSSTCWRARNIDFFLFYQGFDMATDAAFVEDVAAW